MDGTVAALLDVRSMLERLRQQAVDVEAEVGEAPTALEALEWALAEVDQRVIFARAAGPTAGS